MRWRCLKCKTVVEREDQALTAVYCCKCQCWRKPIRPVVGVRVRKPTKRAKPRTVVVPRCSLVHIPGCNHDHQMIIEEGPDQNFLFEPPGEAN